jgi:hypothetical protein
MGFFLCVLVQALDQLVVVFFFALPGEKRLLFAHGLELFEPLIDSHWTELGDIWLV